MPWIQQIPGVASNSAIQSYYSEAVELVFPKGWENHRNFMPARTFDDGVFYDNMMIDGKVRKKAGFRYVDSEPVKMIRICNLVFSVASALTLQYYLNENQCILEDVRDGIWQIRQFLEDDKLSKLEADDLFINDISAHIDTIIQYTVQNQPSLVTVQRIRNDTMASILLYKSQAERSVLEATSCSKTPKKACDKILRAYSMIEAYWFAIQVYCRTRVVELLLTNIWDTSYTQDVQREINNLCDQYEKKYKDWTQRMAEIKNNISESVLNNAAKKYGISFLSLLAGTAISVTARSFKPFIASVAFATGTGASGVNDQKKGNQTIKRLEEEAYRTLDLSKIEHARDLSQYIEIMDGQYHSPLHLAVAEDSIYYKSFEANPDFNNEAQTLSDESKIKDNPILKSFIIKNLHYSNVDNDDIVSEENREEK